MLSKLVNKLGYNGMAAWGDDILKGANIGAEMGDSHTRTFLKNLKPVTGSLPYPATTINLEEYITEANHLRESTSSGPSIVNPAMAKTEALDPELREIGWRIFNFPWCTG